MPYREGADASSGFGDVAGYPLCSCCGGFHAVYESGVISPFGALNADDRGGAGPNGKISFTTDQAAAQLGRTNITWGSGLGQSANVTFAFRSTEPTTYPTDTQGFQRFTDVQIAVTLQALQGWSDVANITFTRVNDGDGYSNNATMLFSNYTSGQGGSAAFAYLPGSSGAGSNSGDVWINGSLSYNSSPVLLGYGFQVLTHEIGHAIGLSHPAAYNAGEGVTISYANDAVYYEDSRQYTVMSYFNESNTGGNFNSASGARQYSAAPLLDDIAAAQRLYGVNTTTRTGDTVYGFNSNADRDWFRASTASTDVIFAVWDAGGNDTFDFSGYSDNTVIDLRQGAFSSVGGLTGNVAIAIGAVIENAIGGSGSERIFGNGADNRLTGGGGNDTIDGGLGIDTAIFSGNRSAYTITFDGTRTTISGPDGTDVLTNVEFFQFADQIVAAQAPTGGLTLSGDVTDNAINGTAFNDVLSGLGGADTLNGLGGDDSLDGGTGADRIDGGSGADTVIGGAGNDTLTGGDGIDWVVFRGSGGTGVVVNLAAGTASGGDGTDSLSGFENVVGSAYNDTIVGDAGNNVIEGGGGSDSLKGGAGDDRITATGQPAQGGGAPDIVKGQATANATIGTAINIDGGFDLLARSDVGNSTTVPHATIVARTHGDVEYYAFTVGAGATVVFDIDGATFDSTLRLFTASGTELASNDDNNVDNGGERTDSYLTYTFQTAGVYYIQVAEWLSGSGANFTSKPPAAGASYTLHVSIPGHAVVPLSLIGSVLEGEDGNDILVGGAGGDTIFGGTGNDSIQGGGGDDGLLQGGQGEDTVDGGDGNDFVFGGQGNDTLFGGLGDDFVQGNLGNDIVYGGVGSDTLLGGQGLDTLFGEDGNDLILGDLGNDQLFGGAGADTLQGGAGSDTLNGGDGIDIAAYTKAVNQYYIESTGGGGWRVYDGVTDVDVLIGVEWGWFAGASPEDLSVAAGKSFDSYGYMVGYADLLAAFRNDPLGAYLHYFREGQAQGRVADSFDGLAYIASHADLIQALGTNGNAGSRHYVLNGQAEGRGITFSATNYLNAHADLRAAFGNDRDAATRHYIQYGFAEGRSTGGAASPAETVGVKPDPVADLDAALTIPAGEEQGEGPSTVGVDDAAAAPVGAFVAEGPDMIFDRVGEASLSGVERAQAFDVQGAVQAASRVEPLVKDALIQVSPLAGVSSAGEDLPEAILTASLSLHGLNRVAGGVEVYDMRETLRDTERTFYDPADGQIGPDGRAWIGPIESLT
jgi:serralysin